MFNIRKIKSLINFLPKDKLLMYAILLIIFIFSLYLLFDIFIWLRVQAFIISHEIIINGRYALELSLTKNEKIAYNFYYSPERKTILYYWVYGVKTGKAYLLPQLLPSGIRGISTTNTYTFYFENGNIYPEGKIKIYTFLGFRVIKFLKNGTITFE